MCVICVMWTRPTTETSYSMRDRDHWGVWLTKEGWRYEGYAVDNHFDVRTFSGEIHVTCPTGVYVGNLASGTLFTAGTCVHPHAQTACMWSFCVH